MLPSTRRCLGGPRRPPPPRSAWGLRPALLLASWLAAGIGWPALSGCASARTPPQLPPPVPDLVAANEALGDPYGGRFPLEEALEGLPGEGPLHARIFTDEGEIDCVLDLRHAPLTVANFVGLARGRRPFVGDDAKWHTEPFFEDLLWHRAEEGQFVQTGRRGHQATGGFLLQDEVGYGDSFDRAGVLAMANTGVEHSGSTQWFITTGPVPHLEGAHTIFGQCDDEAVVRALERRVARGQRSVRLQRVEIHRESAPSG
ncbi:MAG: peptidylprolyl isomerase [Myxococcota bacterium]